MLQRVRRMKTNSFISEQSQLYRQAESYDNHYRGEYPVTGTFHSIRRAIVQVLTWTIDLLWWVIVMGMFGLTFAVPVIFFALMVK